MNEEIYNLAAQAGATDEHGHSVKTADVVCFTRTEFDGFIQRLVEYQTSELYTYRRELENDFMGDDVPSAMMIGHLKTIMGIE